MAGSAGCACLQARIVRDAAVAAGAPPGIISWIESPSLPVSQALMSAREISLILATGGPGMVRAAYSSGNPAVGVGAGNTPAIIDESADVQSAVSSVLLSKTFDNGKWGWGGARGGSFLGRCGWLLFAPLSRSALSVACLLAPCRCYLRL